MNSFGPALFSLVFIAIGAGILFYDRKVAAKARRSLSWPSTEGVIAHSAVLLSAQQISNSSNAPTYKADVAYRYKVQGRDYSSSRITLMDYSSSAAGHAQDIVSRYPGGAPATVYYDPTDPSDSVLEPGGTSGIAILKFIGWAFAAAGLFFLYMSVTGRIHTGR